MSIPVRQTAWCSFCLLLAVGLAIELGGCPTTHVTTLCGQAGQACCAHSACDTPAVCVQDICLGSRPDSGPDAGLCACAEDDGGTDAGKCSCADDGGIDAGQCACLDMSDGGADAGDGGADAGPCKVFNPSNLTGWCSLSGSWVYDSCGAHLVGTDPGLGAVAPGTWLTLPAGYCAHHYATVANARQIRFAPNGDLFVASPTQPSTGGGPSGLAEIVVVPDDNQDGYGDTTIQFRGNLPATQGMLFANGNFYYQFPDTGSPTCGNGTTPVSATIVSEPYTSGQRTSSGSQTPVIEILTYCSDLHWPKALDISDNGTIYVGNGGDQGEVCAQPMPTHGGIWQVDGTADGSNVVYGMRNPYAIKCHHDGNNNCYSTELSLDYSAAEGGREKLIRISPGEDVGFPCCATANLAYPNLSVTPNCSGVVSELDSFTIGDTPFGLAFIDSQFPAPWNNTVFVSQHGAAGTWVGARIVGIALDPTTGIPEPGSDTSGTDIGAMSDFATGWDDGTYTHGRPADMDVSSDGRLFVSSDTTGEIFWVAPVTTN